MRHWTVPRATGMSVELPTLRAISLEVLGEEAPDLGLRQIRVKPMCQQRSK